MRQLPILIILSLFLISVSSYGQRISQPRTNEKIDSLVIIDNAPKEWKFSCRVIETEAKFKKGPGDWETYLQKNLKKDVPKKNGCPPGKFTVRINFVVSKDGKVTIIKAITNYGYGMENEAIRIISLSPKWTPATRNGRIVNAFRFQLITFNVCESENVDLITSICKDKLQKPVKRRLLPTSHLQIRA